MNLLINFILDIIQIVRRLQDVFADFMWQTNIFVWTLSMVSFVVLFGYCLFLYLTSSADIDQGY